MHFAGQGDSFLLEFEDAGTPRRVLVDGGNVRSEYARSLRPSVGRILAEGRPIDLVVATHFDGDHIEGLRWLAADLRARPPAKSTPPPIAELWFNSPKLRETLLSNSALSPRDVSLRQAIALEASLNAGPSHLASTTRMISSPGEHSLFGGTATILCPTGDAIRRAALQTRDIGAGRSDHGESLANLLVNVHDGPFDQSKENACSIAFLFERDGRSFLFLGDATPAALDFAIEALCDTRGVERLIVDALTLPHHGSIKSISTRFLQRLETTKFLISTNGGHNLPNKSTFAKILANRTSPDTLHFYFNYSSVLASLGFTEAERKQYRFEVHCPTRGEELTLCFP